MQTLDMQPPILDSLHMSNPTPPVPVEDNVGLAKAYSVSGRNIAGGETITCIDGGFKGHFSAALSVVNYLPNDIEGQSVVTGGKASYGLDCYNWLNNRGKAFKGSMCGVQGFVTGDQSFQLGISGCSFTFTPETTNIGMCGFAGSPGVNVGIWAAISDPANIHKELDLESCALLVETRKPNTPLMLGFRDGEKVVELDGEGRLSLAAPQGTERVAVAIGQDNGALILEAGGKRYRLEPVG